MESSLSAQWLRNPGRLRKLLQTSQSSVLFNSSLDTKPRDVTSESVGLFFMLLIDLTAIVGNVAIMTVIIKTPALRKFVFVFHLCLVDLLAAVTLMPLAMLSSSAFFDGTIFGDAICRTYLFLSVCFITMCILSVSAINVERYYYVVHPMRYEVKMTIGLVVCVLVGVWIKAVVMSIIPILGWLSQDHVSSPPLYHEQSCTLQWSRSAYCKFFMVFLLFSTSSCLSPLSWWSTAACSKWPEWLPCTMVPTPLGWILHDRDQNPLAVGPLW
ncbi:hypothetical protein JRQ81_015066 [Phrynocephalus forsythii]|uniref:G-protein coupled receptors family 1 profile domain-containing protein n=1 Tax=Phrynocephalus forsythii TaxID=171643 RepID=A0A9Q0XYK1_9SAUR|nr:hypothetical protein JRQ81_015066 [Phrynocephalus forsythii]